MKRTAENRFAMPYLGPDSFQSEDAELFFGRQRDAEQLIAMILSARCTLLHAQSGAGKTSLLNTVIIPRLEAGRHTPIRVLPQDDPIEAVRTATLQQMLPPPTAEIEALDRACGALGLAGSEPLGELLRRFDQLQPETIEGRTSPATEDRGRQETRRWLLSPIDVEGPAESVVLPAFGLVMPWLCRLLRASVEIDTYAAHLAAISPTALGVVDTRIPLTQLRELLSAPRFAAEYAALIERLYLPIPGLRPFFENLLEVYNHRSASSQRSRRVSLVLIFDQLEELFTRFVDRRQELSETPGHQPSWRLRWQFFRELESLYAVDDPASSEDEPEPRQARLPLRFVISIRNEFVAQLDAIRRMVPDLGRSTYHLKLLGKDDAATAIRDPAARYGVRYSAECVERIVDQLALEERYVEPPYIQIICDRLWRKRGSALAAGTAQGEITVDDFRALGETAGILDRFFTDFLAELDGDEERLETLEMLQRLITTSGTRNIVARDELASAPFRRPELRIELLGQLQNGNIVRIERRVGTHFVEITHEFLIGPIQQALRREITRNIGYREFLTALEDLARAKLGRGLREERRELLKSSTIEVLEQHESRLRWGYLGTEAMLRGAILAGLDEATLERWSERLRDGEEMWDAARLLDESQSGGRKSRLLALDELAVVNTAIASGSLDAEQLEPDQLELVLRSILMMANDEDRELIVTWTQEAIRDET